MKRGFSDWPCSVARAADVFGDAWTLLILRDCIHGVTRFDDFQKSLQIARNTLSDRLSGLVNTGVLTKRFYQDNPPRYEYLLTEMGHDLFPVVSAMLAWGTSGLAMAAGLLYGSITRHALTTWNHRSCADTAVSRSSTPKSNSASGRDSPRRSTAGPTSGIDSPRSRAQKADVPAPTAWRPES